MHTTAPTDEALTAMAVERIRAEGTPGTPLAVLLSTGDGARASAVTDALRRSLANPPGVVFSTVQHSPQAPVADPGTPGGHVNPEGFAVTPWPHVVVRVSVSGATLYIAARPPGTDPLGPPDNGWTWVLSSP